MRFDSDRRYELPVSPTDLWSALERVDDYRSWWPWLRRFDAGALEAGHTWLAHVQPPIPYWVRFAVRIDDADAPRSINATVSGDVVGEARLEISDHPAGCEARLVSSLAPGNGVLKVVARMASPVVRFGHDWVLDTGARQFIRRAL